MSIPKSVNRTVKRRGLAIATAVAVAGSGFVATNYASAQEVEPDPTYEQLKAEFGDTEADKIAHESAQKAYEALINGNPEDVDRILSEGLKNAAGKEGAGYTNDDLEAVGQDEIDYQVSNIVSEEKEAAKLAHAVGKAKQEGKSADEIRDIINDGLKQAGFSDDEVAGVADDQVAAIVDDVKQEVGQDQPDVEQGPEFGEQADKVAQDAAAKAAAALKAGASVAEVEKIFADAVKDAAKTGDAGFDENDVDESALQAEIADVLKEEHAAEELAHKVAEATREGKSADEIRDIINDGLKQAGFSDDEVAGVADDQVAAIVDDVKQEVGQDQPDVEQGPEFGEQADKVAQDAAAKAAAALKAGASVAEVEKIFADAVKDAAKTGDAGFDENDVDESALQAEIADVLKEEHAAEELEKTKSAATTQVEGATRLTANQKSEFKGRIGAAKTVEEVKTVLDEAHQLVDKQATEEADKGVLADEKVQAHRIIDSLDKLSPEQKAAFKKQVDDANTGAYVAHVVERAQEMNAQQNPSGDGAGAQEPGKPGSDNKPGKDQKPGSTTDAFKGFFGLAAGMGVFALIFGGIMHTINHFDGFGVIQEHVRNAFAKIGIRF